MTITVVQAVLFIGLGVLVGAFGTLIGAGGGFLLVPVLLWLYPNQPPEIIASISLAVVFFNAFSGTFAYARMKRVEYRSGLMFAAAALPGTILGALSTAYIPRRVFDAIIGTLLVLASVALLVRNWQKQHPQTRQKSGSRFVTITESSGLTHTFSYNPWLGIGLSVIVGYLSSVLGIGGGIIHVPALVQLLNFPVHVATATSHFILALMAFSGSVTHLASGDLQKAAMLALVLSIGVIIGAQFGACLSSRLHGVWIMRALAVALFFVGLRTLWLVVK